MTPAVAASRLDAILTLTMDRPRAANAIDSTLADGLVSGLHMAAIDDTVRAVVLTGAGARVFSGGIDLKEASDLEPAVRAAHRADRLLRCLDAMIGFPKPLVVAVNGVASGAGAMLALLGDRAVAADTAAFVLPEIDLDMPSFIGLAVLSWSAGEALARELVLTGRRLDAAEARARWLVAACVAPAALPDAALREAALLAAKPARAFALVKAAVARERRAQLAVAVAETERVRAQSR